MAEYLTAEDEMEQCQHMRYKYVPDTRIDWKGFGTYQCQDCLLTTKSWSSIGQAFKEWKKISKMKT